MFWKLLDCPASSLLAQCFVMPHSGMSSLTQGDSPFPSGKEQPAVSENQCPADSLTANSTISSVTSMPTTPPSVVSFAPSSVAAPSPSQLTSQIVDESTLSASGPTTCPSAVPSSTVSSHSPSVLSATSNIATSGTPLSTRNSPRPRSGVSRRTRPFQRPIPLQTKQKRCMPPKRRKSSLTKRTASKRAVRSLVKSQCRSKSLATLASVAKSIPSGEQQQPPQQGVAISPFVQPELLEEEADEESDPETEYESEYEDASNQELSFSEETMGYLIWAVLYIFDLWSTALILISIFSQRKH